MTFAAMISGLLVAVAILHLVSANSVVSGVILGGLTPLTMTACKRRR